eukprot:COSAG02_NODE_3440_length_6739_cov_10.354819_5_plen_401_part_00
MCASTIEAQMHTAAAQTTVPIVLALVACSAPPVEVHAQSTASSTRASKCSVTEHGAVGDGTTLDTAAIAKAIEACDHVIFPAGKHFLTGTIALRSNLTLEVDGDILGAAGHILTPPKNPFLPKTPFMQTGGYQDYGHSHWADSLLYGDSVSDVTVMGSGTIDGNGALGQGQPKKPGTGCKAFGLVGSSSVTIQGVSIKHGGWFSILATDCEHLTISGVTIAAARDAMDIMGCRHVLITRMNISGGGDDAVKFGSDWSRGKTVDSYNVTVTNSVVGSNGCNALQFGSETLGNFHGYRFENITITAAGKAGIGIVTMDGALISNITYRNITMQHTTSPIFMYVGGRLRSPLNKPGNAGNDTLVGGIRDVVIEDVHISQALRPVRVRLAIVKVGIHQEMAQVY